jgi:hypothetical protein
MFERIWKKNKNKTLLLFLFVRPFFQSQADASYSFNLSLVALLLCSAASNSPLAAQQLARVAFPLLRLATRWTPQVTLTSR